MALAHVSAATFKQTMSHQRDHTRPKGHICCAEWAHSLTVHIADLYLHYQITMNCLPNNSSPAEVTSRVHYSCTTTARNCTNCVRSTRQTKYKMLSQMDAYANTSRTSLSIQKQFSATTMYRCVSRSSTTYNYYEASRSTTFCLMRIYTNSNTNDVNIALIQCGIQSQYQWNILTSFDQSHAPTGNYKVAAECKVCNVFVMVAMP